MGGGLAFDFQQLSLAAIGDKALLQDTDRLLDHLCGASPAGNLKA